MDRELRLGSLDFALLLFWWIYVYLYTVTAWQYVYPDSAAYGRNLNFAYLVEKFAFLGALALLWVAVRADGEGFMRTGLAPVSCIR